VIRMQKFTWNGDGTPSFGTPVASGVPVLVPSGQCR
jgi:GH43 family beta-xylosidase